MSEHFGPEGTLPGIMTADLNEERHVSTGFLGHLHVELKRPSLDLVPRRIP